MNVLTDFLSTIRAYSNEVSNIVKKEILGVGIDHKSLNQKSKSFIATFPNITSKTLDKKTMNLVNRCIEVKNANLLKIVLNSKMFSNAALGFTDMDDELGLSYSDSPDLSNILRKIHRDLDEDCDALIGLLETYDENYEVNKALYEELLKEINEKPLKTVSNNSLNNLFIENTSLKVFNEAANIKGHTSLEDNEVKAINNLSPTIINHNMLLHTGKQLESVAIQFGVKSKIYPVNTETLIEALGETNKNAMVRFLQLTTGEIKFLKDFIINLEDIKSTAKGKESKKLFSILKRRSSRRKSSFGGSMANANISTLTISVSDVAEYKDRYGKDILDEKVARSIMNYYGFMHICVIDEVDEEVHIISDSGNDTYETFAFGFLSKELDSALEGKALRRTSGF